jgi:PAS domain S-box-containing protein
MIRIPRLGIGWGQREGPKAIVARYCSTFVVVAVAVALRYWLDPYLAISGAAIWLTAILIGAWVGGLGPGLIGQTLILFAEALLFSGPSAEPFELTFRAAVNFAVFYMVGGIVGLLSELRQAALERAQIEKEEALSQREQLRATLSCMGDGVLVADAEGCLTIMNPVAEALTGWTISETKGMPVSDVFAICDEQSQQTVENPVKRVLRDGQVLHEEMRLILTTRNEQSVPVAYSAAPIQNARGRITGVVLVFRDETDRRRTEQALRNADRRKDEFLATLAHELRNPLAPISMGLELLKMSDDDPQATIEVRGMMERQAQHMVRLIDDLLDVSRITRGKLELRKCPVELADVVRDAIDATRPLFDEAGHELSVKLPEQPVLIYADPNRLTQVLSNLLNNAAKYTPRGGRVELSAEHQDAEVRVTITDNGQGIPAEKLDEIFEMFTQVHESTRSGHQGLGIGLTLVKRLVEMHGGTVEVCSAGRGQGSRFTVRLPLLRPAALPESNSRSGGEQLATTPTRRILVVDDNEDALQMLSMLVGALGHDVSKARDGLEAVEAAERLRPEIILMDLGMPNLNGFEAARRIRNRPWGREIVLIATTGWGQDEDRRRTKDAGFDHHLVKPIEPAVLCELLKSPPLFMLVPKRSDMHASKIAAKVGSNG